jgi:hypothetical protein
MLPVGLLIKLLAQIASVVFVSLLNLLTLVMRKQDASHL